MYGSFQKAIANSKLSFMEKYGYAQEEELNMLSSVLGAQITYSEDGKTARVSCNNVNLQVIVKR